jgi:hypothetical protein
MGKLGKPIAAIFGGSEKTQYFFDVIAPILRENENQAPHMRGATLATVNLLQITLRELQKFDLGQEWVQESKFRRNGDLLQAALYNAFLLGTLTAGVPAAEQFRRLYLKNQGAWARAARQPGLFAVENIVQDELKKFLAKHPSSKLAGNAIAGRIMEAVNQRLAESKKQDHCRIGQLSQNAIAKRINGIRTRTVSKASD